MKTTERIIFTILAFLPVSILLAVNLYIQSRPISSFGAKGMESLVIPFVIMFETYPFLIISFVLSIAATIACLIQMILKKKLGEKIGYYLFLMIISAVPLLYLLYLWLHYAVGLYF